MDSPVDTSEVTAVQRWERRSERPLAITAVVFLIAYSWLILQPDMSAGLHQVLQLIDYVAWVVFGIDYIIRVTLARPRGRYVVRNLLDLLSLALPVLRPLRLLRLLVLLKALNRQATDSLKGRVIVYVLSGSVLVLFAAALAELDAERGHAGANITTFGNALWWAMTTITTVGYGDHYPVTTEGRFVAVGLMLAGIALLGVVTAAFASWLVGRVRDVETDVQTDTLTEIAELRRQVAQLTTLIEAGSARDAARGGQ